MDMRLLMTPQQQTFHKQLLKLLKLHGMWPSQRSSSFTWLSLMLIVMFFMIATLMVVNVLKDYESSVYFTCHMYSSIAMLILVESRFVVVTTKLYARQIKWFYRKLHLANYKYHDKATTKILYVTERRCYLLYLVFAFCTVFAPFTYMTAPTISNAINGAFSNTSIPLDSAIHIYTPFDYTYNVANWCLVSCVIFVSSFYVGVINLLFQIVMLYAILHLAGQINVLIYRLDNVDKEMCFGKRSWETFTRVEDDAAFQFLRQSIEHHNFILRSLELLNEMYGSSMFCYYAYDMASCCILLLMLSENWPMSIFKFGPFAFAVFAQLVGNSFAMEQLSILVDELHDAVYRVPWYRMSARNKKLVHVMVIVSQRQYAFKALGVASVNHKAMASILKTTISYFLWLKTMDQA